MAAGDSSPRTVRLITAILLVGTFAAGTLTGAGVVRWASPPPHPRPMGPPPFEGPIPMQELGLSPDQARKAEEIADRYRPELESILRDTFPRVRAVNEKIEAEIRQILTPEQQQRLDRIKASRPPPGPPPGPGRGPWGPPPGPPPFGMPPSPPPSR